MVGLLGGRDAASAPNLKVSEGIPAALPLGRSPGAAFSGNSRTSSSERGSPSRQDILRQGRLPKIFHGSPFRGPPGVNPRPGTYLETCKVPRTWSGLRWTDTLVPSFPRHFHGLDDPGWLVIRRPAPAWLEVIASDDDGCPDEAPRGWTGRILRLSSVSSSRVNRLWAKAKGPGDDRSDAPLALLLAWELSSAQARSASVCLFLAAALSHLS